MVHYGRRERGKEIERLRIKAITFEWHHFLVENLLIEKNKKKRQKKREIDRETERQRERAQGEKSRNMQWESEFCVF